MATGDEDPQAWPPRQDATPVNDGTGTSMRNFTECSVGVLDWLSSCGFAGMTALNQDSEDLPGIGEIRYRGQRGASGR
jgi:hypothetical protein